MQGKSGAELYRDADVVMSRQNYFMDELHSVVIINTIFTAFCKEELVVLDDVVDEFVKQLLQTDVVAFQPYCLVFLNKVSKEHMLC